MAASGLLGLAILLGCATNALAAQQVITSAGPLSSIFLNDSLACQLNHTGDAHGEFFSGSDPGACGTFLATGGTVYGPAVPAGIARTDFTLVSQGTVTGTGTAADPFQVVTIADAGATGLRLTQTDSYVVGQESYRTRIQVQNTGSSQATATLYHAGDCFLQDSDSGFGWFDSALGGIYCASNANNDPAGRLIGFAPVSSPGSHYLEAGYSSVWAAIDGSSFADTCACTGDQENGPIDNGAGLSWALTIPGGGNVTRQLLTASSPAGEVPDSTAPAVTLTTPADNARTASATPTLAGAAGTDTGDLAGITVKIYSGSSATGTPVRTLSTIALAGSWSVAPGTALPAGTYTAQAEQTDESGNLGQSAAHTFTVDTTAPAVTLASPVDGASISDNTPGLSGAAGTAPGDLDAITLQIYSGSSAAGSPVQTLSATQSGGSWSVAPSRTLPDGTYTARATQGDDAGHTGQSDAHTFTVDTIAPAVTIALPAAGPAGLRAADLALGGEAGAAPGDSSTVALRVREATDTTGTPVRSIDVTRAGGKWAATVPGLDPGSYSATATQRDAAGNVGSGGVGVTVDASGTLGAIAVLPPPVLGKAVNVEPIGKGPVYISEPNGTTSIASAVAHSNRYTPPVRRRKFKRLKHAKQIPVGSLVDARKGRLRMTTAKRRKSGSQTADFFKGAFKFTQTRRKKGKGLTTLYLIGKVDSCTATPKEKASASRRRRHRRRRLWGSGHGRFRTRGRHGAATVRGTIWFVEDRCDSTVFRVKRGKVLVQDFTLHKRLTLRKGHVYVAHKKKRKKRG